MTEGDSAERVLLAAAAHDLKTPLIFIKTAAAQLQLPGVEPREIPRQLQRMEYSADRLLGLIDGMIGAAAAGQLALPLEPISVPDVIGQAVEDITAYAAELGFEFDIHVSRDLPPVLSHKTSLRRVLFNLLDNAVKYARRGSSKRVFVRARRDRDHVRISVRDFGVGVRKTDLERIFSLFGRAGEPSASVPGSSGLGLYIANSLSQSLSAELRVKPLREGSSFYVRVPSARQLSLL